MGPRWGILHVSPLPGVAMNLSSQMGPNPSRNRPCNRVRRPGLIALWPGRRSLPHAG